MIGLAEPEIWCEAEQEAWRPLPDILPADWAEMHRFLSRGRSPRPGPWRNENAPYLRFIMNAPARRGVVQVNIMKAAQVGCSEALRNLVGYLADREPDPVGITLPNKEKGRQIVGRLVIPMFRRTPVLARLLSERSHDTAKSIISLANGMTIFLMWSGSPASLASDPMRIVINDEVDKFTPWTGAEVSPVASTWARLRTYEQRKCQVNISTPTTHAGQIFQLWETSDVRLYYFVPCPHCGQFQRLVFPQLKWLKFDEELSPKQHASRLRRTKGSVWYECSACGKEIAESQKAAMVRAGRWSSEDGAVTDADAVAAWPPGTRLGVQIGALCCLWQSWAEVAAEWITARGDPQANFDFRTQTLGEPYEERLERLQSDIFARKSAAAPLAEGLLPEWTAQVIAAIDTQKDHFKVVLRAWGPDMMSARVWHGRVESFQELDKLLVQPWPFAAGGFNPRRVELATIDTGGTIVEGGDDSRTMEVYRWAHPRRSIVRMIKGAGRPRASSYIWLGSGILKSAREQGKQAELPLWFVVTGHFNDLLAELITRGQEGDDRMEIWFLNKRDDPVYNHEMSNMQKVAQPARGRLLHIWMPTMAGAKYDFRHCEVYQIAAAYMANVHLLPPREQFMEFRVHQRDAAKKAAAPPKPDREAPSGWDITPWKRQ